MVCDGEEGKGDGPGSKALDPKPANLSSERVQAQVDEEIYWKISEGELIGRRGVWFFKARRILRELPFKPIGNGL